MQIKLNIKPEQIAELMTTAVESGDPVTRGWCMGIHVTPALERTWRTREGYGWYCNPEFYAQNFSSRIVELDDERTGHKSSHRLTRRGMIRGFEKMVTGYPHIFANIVNQNIDAPTADIFLQCCLFGEEKYA